jgi:hypothetical protein
MLRMMNSGSVIPAFCRICIAGMGLGISVSTRVRRCPQISIRFSRGRSIVSRSYCSRKKYSSPRHGDF